MVAKEKKILARTLLVDTCVRQAFFFAPSIINEVELENETWK